MAPSLAPPLGASRPPRGAGGGAELLGPQLSREETRAGPRLPGGLPAPRPRLPTHRCGGTRAAAARTSPGLGEGEARVSARAPPASPGRASALGHLWVAPGRWSDPSPDCSGPASRSRTLPPPQPERTAPGALDARAGRSSPTPALPKGLQGCPEPPATAQVPSYRWRERGCPRLPGFSGCVRGERNRRFPAGRVGRMPSRGSVSELGLQWCSSRSGLAPGWDPWTPACLRLCGVGSAGQWRVPLHSRYQARAHGHFGDRSPPPGARVPPCPSLPQVGTARAGVRRRLLGSPTCPLQDRGANCPAGARVPTPARGHKTGSGGRLWPPALPTGRVF